jgi:MFS family permease
MTNASAPPKTASGHGWALPAERAFWIFAAAITVIVLGANTPLPLLTVYQSAWHFSTAILTLIYGLYTVGVVLAVFIVGPASDQVGRKRMLLPALALMGLGLAGCLLAPNVWLLMAARIVQGLAVGAGVTTAVAALGELHPDPRDHGRIALTATLATVLGLAGGPLVAGSLAQFSAAPTVTPYAVAILLTCLVFLGVAFSPETVTSRAKFRLRSATIRIPSSVLPPFLLATYVELTAYAVAGTFAGLGASFAKVLLHVQSHFAAGLVVALLFLCSAAAQLAGRRLPLQSAMIIGLLTLLAGLALFVLAVLGGNAAAFFTASAVLGLGHGLAYLGSQELTGRIAPPDRRAEIFSGFQLGLYAGATVPAIAVGFAARAIGLAPATIAFIAVVAALAVAGIAWVRASKFIA